MKRRVWLAAGLLAAAAGLGWWLMAGGPDPSDSEARAGARPFHLVRVPVAVVVVVVSGATAAAAASAAGSIVLVAAGRRRATKPQLRADKCAPHSRPREQRPRAPASPSRSAPSPMRRTGCARAGCPAGAHLHFVSAQPSTEYGNNNNNNNNNNSGRLSRWPHAGRPSRAAHSRPPIVGQAWLGLARCAARLLSAGQLANPLPLASLFGPTRHLQDKTTSNVSVPIGRAPSGARRTSSPAREESRVCAHLAHYCRQIVVLLLLHSPHFQVIFSLSLCSHFYFYFY